ncbi:SDR family oxidoreductase [Pseudothauera lacus]|uniref:NAD-dependent dehydratase n=1 Tax=Pseudothauera lacus TaxID=2136175 RepID=A0A2T4IEX3_9RHOO|nr:SDR family oxidoreductase [Pseudothauera lacus]PTD96317.1 NAD-dependent dehydratase [Pseudothauera lacus]
MRILVCGAGGFLGRAICTALSAEGHLVVRGLRRPATADDIAIDFRQDTSVDTWLPRLGGIDAVVNAVGILREHQAGDFDAIHHRAPAALFAACAQRGIDKVVQISALGAARGGTAYLDSKARADAALLAQPGGGVVLRPALIYGEHGTSARFFRTLASLPVHPVPAGCRVQPVHVDDLVDLIVRVLRSVRPHPVIVDLPGPRPLSFAELLACYRKALGLAPAMRIRIPGLCLSLASGVAERFPGSLLTRDTWAMLRAGNCGDPAPATALLGRPLRDSADFVPAARSPELRQAALATWRRPMLQGVLALIWLVTAWVSLAVWPWADSLAMLALFGLSGALGVSALIGASVLDLAMAVLTVVRPGRRLWQAQLLLIGAYSALIAWQLPEFLHHPFGPILKNLAVAAILVQLWAEETS